MKLRDGDQPLPVPNDARDVQSQVIEDIAARRQVGIERYGTALQPHNGRDALRDAVDTAARIFRAALTSPAPAPQGEEGQP